MSMWHMGTSAWVVTLRTLAVYGAVFVGLRLMGKREIGQMTVFDLVVILLIANAVQNAMNGGDNSLLGGVIAASTLVAMNLLFGRVASRAPLIGHLFASEPTLLMDDGKLIQKHLDRENVSVEELEMAARERGIDDLANVKAAILERDGSISIIGRDGAQTSRARRRLRQLRKRS
jgi:uncharacterized membrane protein YcaP (DUF421 family)